MARGLSKKKRAALIRELGVACNGYIRGDPRTALAARIDGLPSGCLVVPDEVDVNGQTLYIEYPTLFPSSEVAYVAPRVKIEDEQVWESVVERHCSTSNATVGAFPAPQLEPGRCNDLAMCCGKILPIRQGSREATLEARELLAVLISGRPDIGRTARSLV